MAFYDQMQGVADKLLTDFNQGVIELVQITPGSGPAHNPGPSTTTTTPLKGTARAAKGSILLAPGSLVKIGDLKVVAKVAKGLARAPSTGDKIKVDGVTYSIIRFDPTPPAGVTVAWIFYVRRS